MNEPRKFKCAMCRKDFTSSWTEEEALAEYAENFPKSKESSEQMDVVCDDCYNKMMGILPASKYEKTL